MSKIALHSNCGDHRLEFLSMSELRVDGEPAYDVSIRVAGQHFDGEHSRSVSAMTDGLYVSQRELRRMVEELRGWLALSLAEMAAAPLAGTYSLSPTKDQRLDITFGEREDVIAASNHVVSFRIEVGRLRAQYFFVTDQSCVRAFQIALERRLGKRPAN